MIGDNTISEIFLCEFLVTTEQDIPTHTFLAYLNAFIGKEGYELYNNYIEQGKVKIGAIEIEKIYPSNTKRKDVFFLMKIFALKDEDKNEESDENSFDNYFFNLPSNTPLFKFRNLLKTKIELSNPIFKKIFLTKDDYASFLLLKSYPIILDIENTMRELVYKTLSFMGKKNWEKSEMPNDILTQIKDEQRKKLGVYGTDFSHLSHLLFDITEKNNISNLLSYLSNLEKCNSRTLSKIQNMVPKSNWEKYFSTIHIQKNLEEIKKRFTEYQHLTDSKVIVKLLDDLRIMRNKVAHNYIFIDYDFYDILEQKSYFFKKWIKESIEYIEQQKIEESINIIKQNFSDSEKQLFEKIEKLKAEIANYYEIDKNNINSFLYSEYYEYDEEEDKEICKIPCVKKIIRMINLSDYMLKQTRKLQDDDIDNHLDDINVLIQGIDEDCPKILYKPKSFSRHREFI